MKLLELKIEGFRSLRNVVWKPGDLNVLIGPNAGGKSNLLKALHLLAVSAPGDLSRHLVRREGGIGSVVWDGRAESIKFSLLLSDRVLSGDTGNDRLSYGVWLDRSGKSASYSVHHEWLYSGTVDSPPSATTPILDRIGNRGTLYEPVGQPLHQFDVDTGQEETVLKSVSHPSLPHTRAGDVARDLSAWAVHYGFQTDSRAAIREPPIARTEFVLDSNGDNLTNVLHTLYTNSREFESELGDAMSAAFGEEFVKFIFSPDAGDQRVQLRVRWKHLERDCSQADLSDGTLRFLYLLAILANPNPPPLIAIDEPEAGLHPSMLRIVAEFAAEASRRSQVILATHSAELLDALSEFKPVSHVVESHNGETEIRTLAGEKLDYWLSKYSLGELYRTSGLEAAT